MVRSYQRAILRGTWLYEYPVRKSVYIIEQNYDYWAEMAKSDDIEYDEPTAINRDGLGYYISFDPNLPLNKDASEPIRLTEDLKSKDLRRRKA